jgi:hypothetical protein
MLVIKPQRQKGSKEQGGKEATRQRQRKKGIKALCGSPCLPASVVKKKRNRISER